MLRIEMIRAVMLSVIGSVMISGNSYSEPVTENNIIIESEVNELQTGYVTCDKLNLRAEPNTTCDVLEILEYNSELQLEQELVDNEWYRGYKDDKIFYVNKNYISFTKLPVNRYLGKYRITYYCSCRKCTSTGNGITKSGTLVTEGRTASCNSLPIGTRVIIDGNEYVIEDTGSMKNNIIDIYVSSHQKALELGTHYSDVYVRK